MVETCEHTSLSHIIHFILLSLSFYSHSIPFIHILSHSSISTHYTHFLLLLIHITFFYSFIFKSLILHSHHLISLSFPFPFTLLSSIRTIIISFITQPHSLFYYYHHSTKTTLTTHIIHFITHTNYPQHHRFTTFLSTNNSHF